MLKKYHLSKILTNSNFQGTTFKVQGKHYNALTGRKLPTKREHTRKTCRNAIHFRLCYTTHKMV